MSRLQLSVATLRASMYYLSCTRKKYKAKPIIFTPHSCIVSIWCPLHLKYWIQFIIDLLTVCSNSQMKYVHIQYCIWKCLYSILVQVGDFFFFKGKGKSSPNREYLRWQSPPKMLYLFLIVPGHNVNFHIPIIVICLLVFCPWHIKGNGNACERCVGLLSVRVIHIVQRTTDNWYARYVPVFVKLQQKSS